MSIIRSDRKFYMVFAGIFITAGIAAAYASILAKKNKQIAAALDQQCTYTGTSFGFRTRECEIRQHSPDNANGAGTSSKISYVLAGWDGEAASSLYLASGEKSVVAGQGQVMAMGILETGKGQTAPDGMPVDFYSDGILFARGVTRGGVAQVYLDAPTRAGTIEIMAKAENINTTTNFIRVVPADPVSIKVNRLASSNRTVSENEVWVKTDVLADQYGNSLSDGTFIQFSGSDQSGRNLLLNAVAINGIASAKVLNRNLTDRVVLKALHKNVVGEQTSLSFHTIQLEDDLNVKITDSIGQLEVTIGPVLRNTGGFVPDGTLFKLTSNNGHLYNSVTAAGYVVFRMTHDHHRKHIQVGNPHFKIEANGRSWIIPIDDLDDNENSEILTGEAF